VPCSSTSTDSETAARCLEKYKLVFKLFSENYNDAIVILEDPLQNLEVTGPWGGKAEQPGSPLAMASDRLEGLYYFGETSEAEVLDVVLVHLDL